jgi:hypothetical protein
VRVERFFRGAQGFGEQRRALAVIPGTMIAPDRVVVRDVAAIIDHRVKRCALNREPLRAEPTRLAQGMEREVRCGVCVPKTSSV